MSRGAVHSIGAGVAGLSCAVAVLRRGGKVVVHEAAGFAGGCCRSYFEPALGLTIDNGNHLVLSGNRTVLDYVEAIGAAGKLRGPEEATFAFADLATGARGSAARRVPGTRAQDYLVAARLLRAGPSDTVAGPLGGSGALYDRLWHPVLLGSTQHRPTGGVGRGLPEQWCAKPWPRAARRAGR